MLFKIGDWGYFKSINVPWDLGKTYHAAKFQVFNTSFDNKNRPCVYIEIKTLSGKRLRRWTTVESLRYMVLNPSPQIEPIKKICRFDFKSGMNPKIYHSY